MWVENPFSGTIHIDKWRVKGERDSLCVMSRSFHHVCQKYNLNENSANQF